MATLNCQQHMTTLHMSLKLPYEQKKIKNVFILNLHFNDTAFHEVGDVKAIDREGDATLRYYITSGNEDNKFSINRMTGAIAVISTLDREMEDEYRLQVEARDESVAQYKDTAFVSTNLA